MKLAIIGSGPLAIYAAAHFSKIGAHVVLFQRSPLGGNIAFCLHQKIDLEVDYPENKSVEQFWTDDLIPLIEYIEENKLTKKGEVLRVSKRFLHRNEDVKNRTRLLDLFRVVYSTNPKDSILKQLEENPEIFKQLGEKVVESLHEPVESFEDFDIVIEATGRGKSDFKMGPAGTLAINEKNLQKHSHFYYGKSFFEKFNDDGIKKIVLVGDDLSAYLALNKLTHWLFSHPDHKLTWISHSIINRDNKLVKNIFEQTNSEWILRKDKFEIELRAWRDLEDYMKAKIAKPIEPEIKLTMFEGYNITSVDKLLDREGVFVTIESPDFRSHANTKQDLRTIAGDVIVIQNGTNKWESLGESLIADEPGYYVINSDNLKDGVLEILKIEEKVMNFFSKSDQ
jgi:hypothetical protein